MTHKPLIADDAVFAEIDPKYARMRDHLAGLSANGLPSDSDVDADEFPELASFLNRVDVLYENEIRFRYRVVGRAQNRLAGRLISGFYLEEAVLPEFVERIRANMMTCVETRKPVYDRFPMPHPERTFVESERVYFPLAADGKTVDTLLILNGYIE